MKDVLTNLAKLPEQCAAMLNGNPVFIRRGAREPTAAFGPDLDHWNASRGITDAQVKAMIVGVTLGWDMDGADPDTHADATNDPKLPEGPFVYEYDASIDVVVRVEAHAEELAAPIARDYLRELLNELDPDNYPGISSFAEGNDLELLESTDPREQ